MERQGWAGRPCADRNGDWSYAERRAKGYPSLTEVDEEWKYCPLGPSEGKGGYWSVKKFKGTGAVIMNTY